MVSGIAQGLKPVKVRVIGGHFFGAVWERKTLRRQLGTRHYRRYEQHVGSDQMSLIPGTLTVAELFILKSFYLLRFQFHQISL